MVYFSPTGLLLSLSAWVLLVLGVFALLVTSAFLLLVRSRAYLRPLRVFLWLVPVVGLLFVSSECIFLLDERADLPSRIAGHSYLSVFRYLPPYDFEQYRYQSGYFPTTEEANASVTELRITAGIWLVTLVGGLTVTFLRIAAKRRGREPPIRVTPWWIVKAGGLLVVAVHVLFLPVSPSSPLRLW